MLRQLTAMWAFRHFLLALVRLDLRLRYKRSLLGSGWSLITPMLMTLVFVIVFSNLLGADPREYTTFLLLGMAVWGFFRECAINGCQALVNHESYIRQSPLPFGIYTLRIVLGQAIHSSIALVLAVAAVMLLKGTWDRPVILWAVAPGLLMALLVGWAAATLFAFANVYFRDTQHLLEVAAQILFFLTPIMYKPELLVNQGLGWLAKINLINLFLELIRTPLLTGHAPPMKLYLLAVAGTVMLVGLAFAAIARFRNRVVFHL
jgi:ABC-type polysaccharide/polyol phosphate export permease